MEKSKPVRKSHTSTSDLLIWTENAPAQSPAVEVPSRPGILSHQPSAGVSAALFGGQMEEEEAESLIKPKPCSSSKLKELTGSGIFVGEEENGGASEADGSYSTPANRTGLRLYQQGGCAVSQISFSAEESVSPKKPTTLPEMAKQRELSGTIEREADEAARIKKQLSNAKSKELSGHGVLFPPPAEIPPPPSPVAAAKVSAVTGGLSSIVLGEEPLMKTAKKIYDKKFAELSGTNVFSGGGGAAPASAEKLLSGAKLREISGSDIFADEKITSREYYGGVRKPPGGESSIALV